MREHWFTAADDTRLYARDEGPIASLLTPLLCLPGLTRNSSDFDPVFARYASHRRVIGLDFRGRGKSGFAGDPSTYRPDVELQDTLGFLDHLGIAQVALLGTSRGGIVGLLMGTLARARLSGLCLNDIGCELAPEGLLRIMGYVGQPRRYHTWDETAQTFAASSFGFTNVSHSQWLEVVKRIFHETTEGIVQSHDLGLAHNLPTKEDVWAGTVAQLWSLLPALAEIPVTLIRGAGSDLLSTETTERMQLELPHLNVTTVSNRGHVPFLDETESVLAIDEWLALIDSRKR